MPLFRKCAPLSQDLEAEMSELNAATVEQLKDASIKMLETTSKVFSEQNAKLRGFEATIEAERKEREDLELRLSRPGIAKAAPVRDGAAEMKAFAGYLR